MKSFNHYIFRNISLHNHKKYKMMRLFRTKRIKYDKVFNKYATNIKCNNHFIRLHYDYNRSIDILNNLFLNMLYISYHNYIYIKKYCTGLINDGNGFNIGHDILYINIPIYRGGYRYDYVKLYPDRITIVNYYNEPNEYYTYENIMYIK